MISLDGLSCCEEEVALTTSEVAAMVSMYINSCFPSRNYPINRLVLTEGKQYTD